MPTNTIPANSLNLGDARFTIDEVKSIVRNNRANLYSSHNRNYIDRSIDDLCCRHTNLNIIQTFLLQNGFIKTFNSRVTNVLRYSTIIPLMFESGLAARRTAISINLDPRSIVLFHERVDTSVIAATGILYGVNEGNFNVTAAFEFISMHKSDIDFDYICKLLKDLILRASTPGSYLKDIMYRECDPKLLVMLLKSILNSTDNDLNTEANVNSFCRSIAHVLYNDNEYSQLIEATRTSIIAYRQTVEGNSKESAV